jgi:hypothetical protein
MIVVEIRVFLLFSILKKIQIICDFNFKELSPIIYKSIISLIMFGRLIASLLAVCLVLSARSAGYAEKSYLLDIVQDTIPSADSSAVFGKVDFDATYPGGPKAWTAYLIKNLVADVGSRNKAPVGRYTVLVQFVIDLEGNVTEITALTNHGYGMEEEVIRLIGKSPRWKPAMLGDQPVKAYRKQPVTFVVIEQERKKRS